MKFHVSEFSQAQIESERERKILNAFRRRIDANVGNVFQRKNAKHECEMCFILYYYNVIRLNTYFNIW